MSSPVTPEAIEVGDHRRGGLGSRFPVRSPSRAEPGTWRGLLWTLVVAADFFLMSNPLVFVVSMDRALTLAALVTGSALTLTLPWVRVPRVAVSVLLFLGWLLLSVTWSIQPTFTAEAWAQTAAIAAVAVAVSANVSARVLVSGVVLGGVVVSVASMYAFHERLPGALFLTESGYVMTGVGTNSNILAYTLALSLCAVCAAFPRRSWTRVAWVGGAVIIGYGLKEADSDAGNLTAAAVLIAAALLKSYEPISRRLICSRMQRAMALVVTVVLAFAGYCAAKAALGQDLLTFSNRTPLWSAALEVAKDEPLLGFGYGAVWQHPWKPPLLNVVIGDIWDRSGTALSHGHNSAIDLIVEVGLVGVVLMSLVMVTAGMRGVGLMHRVERERDGRVMAHFSLLTLVALVLVGITEPMAVIPLGWWTLVLLTEPIATSSAQKMGGLRGGRASRRPLPHPNDRTQPDNIVTRRLGNGMSRTWN